MQGGGGPSAFIYISDSTFPPGDRAVAPGPHLLPQCTSVCLSGCSCLCVSAVAPATLQSEGKRGSCLSHVALKRGAPGSCLEFDLCPEVRQQSPCQKALLLSRVKLFCQGIWMFLNRLWRGWLAKWCGEVEDGSSPMLLLGVWLGWDSSLPGAPPSL